MAFNERVLEEALDQSFPLLERLKFVAILSSNLDEFFMVRVAGLERRVRKRPGAREPDGLPTDQVLHQIRDLALDQKARQGVVLRELLMALKKQGVFLETQLTPSEEHLKLAKSSLKDVKVQTFKNIENFNTLPGGQIFVFVRLEKRFGVLSFPQGMDRLISVPKKHAQAPKHFLLAEKLAVAAAQSFFPKERVIEAFPFKVIRDADFDLDPTVDPDELMGVVESGIKQRKKLPVVRLEIDSPFLSDGALALANTFKVHSRSIYRYDVPMDLKILWRLIGMKEIEHLTLKDPERENLDVMPSLLEGKEILLHHPYDSFDTLEKLLEAAADDKQVMEIRQTLYRTKFDSRLVKALIRAAKKGKVVRVYVELRARFDEERNIDLVKHLKQHGVKVLKGFADKKIHCKLTQILRHEDGEKKSYIHVGTGNYNPTTARVYTDLGLLTSDKVMGEDAERVFKSIQNRNIHQKYQLFVTAPNQLQKNLLEWIKRERKNASKGKPARIIAKINALVDPKIVEALYVASNAGVKIDLIVRGACVLRPGIPKISDNIRVISIVDHYLEHSRIYYFQNGDKPRVYLSSADWMPRNLHSRIEVAFPILDKSLQKFIVETILETYIKDNQKARMLRPDGSWERVQPKKGELKIHAQRVFESLARKGYRGTALSNRV